MNRNMQTIEVGDARATIEERDDRGGVVIRVFARSSRQTWRPIGKFDAFGRSPHWHLFRADGREQVRQLERTDPRAESVDLIKSLSAGFVDSGYSELPDDRGNGLLFIHLARLVDQALNG